MAGRQASGAKPHITNRNDCGHYRGQQPIPPMSRLPKQLREPHENLRALAVLRDAFALKVSPR